MGLDPGRKARSINKEEFLDRSGNKSRGPKMSPRPVPALDQIMLAMERTRIFWASSYFRYLASGLGLFQVVEKAYQALEILGAFLETCISNFPLRPFQACQDLSPG